MPEDQTSIQENQDADQTETNMQAPNQSWWARFKTWYSNRKKWTVPFSILLFLLVLAGVPFTRYALAGTVYKKNLTIKVTGNFTP
jgi:hypothetical protein